MPRRPAAPDGGDTREQILDVALDLFIEQGYDKTSLRQIAEPLGFTQAAIYYHFAAKEDILVALHLRLHELARPVLSQLAAEAGPAGWAAVLRGLVDTVLANRQLFVLHQRNQTALSGLHIKGHDGDHEEIEQQFRQILGDPSIPARDRIRLGCALGALLSVLMSLNDLADLSPEVYGDLLREAITDLLEPRGDASRTRRDGAGQGFRDGAGQARGRVDSAELLTRQPPGVGSVLHFVSV